MKEHKNICFISYKIIFKEYGTAFTSFQKFKKSIQAALGNGILKLIPCKYLFAYWICKLARSIFIKSSRAKRYRMKFVLVLHSNSKLKKLISLIYQLWITDDLTIPMELL